MLIHNISSIHDREFFRHTSDRLLPILELKLKCCFSVYMFHWITIHFLIHYLPFKYQAKYFAVCCLFSLSRALNTAETAWMKFNICLRLYIYIYIIAEKWAYLKYERVLFYFNDRLNGFSTPNLPFKKKKKKVKDCIIVVVSEKGYRLLSYVSPQRKYATYGKTFYQILWGCIMQRPYIAVRQGPFIKNRKIK